MFFPTIWESWTIEQLITFRVRVSFFYTTNVHQIRSDLSNKLDSVGKDTSQQKLLKLIAILDSESICVQEGTYRGTETTKGYKNTSQYRYLFPQTL